MEDCIDFITNNYLSEYNVANKEALPYFSFSTDCNNGGAFYPAALAENQIGVELNKDSTWYSGQSTIQALYIPANWAVQLMTADRKNTVTIRGPYLGNTVENEILIYNGATDVSIFNPFSVSQIQFAVFTRQALLPGRPAPQTFNDSAVQICASNEGLVVAGIPIPVWEPHQPACDALVTTYCQTQHPEDHVTCTCLQEAASLTAQHPHINLPVTCFGPLCGSQGYRTDEMAREYCSVTACQTILFEQGNDIYNSGKTQIYCNGHLYDTRASSQNDPSQPQPTPVLPTPVPHKNSTIPFYIWIVFGIMIAICGLLIYFITKKYGIKKT